MRRFLGIAAGVLVHAVFGVMVWHLYWFLKGRPVSAASGALAVDFLLALQFVVVHSLLLYPAVRERLSPWIAAPFYGLFYCTATTAGLSLTMACWQSSPTAWIGEMGLVDLITFKN